MRFVAPAAAGVVAVFIVASTAAATTSFVLERTTVTIGLPQTRIETRSTLHGRLEGGDFATQRLRVTMTETMEGAASGVSSTPAQYATGSVVFNHFCASPPGGNTCMPTYPVPAGSVLWNNKGTMTYVLLAPVTCFCGESAPVRAWSRGSIGNTAAHTVSLVIQTNGFAYYETADNPRPISGGVDASSSPVVMSSDVTQVSARASAQLTADMQAAMQKKAGSLAYQMDPPSISTTSDARVGERTSTFRVTASGSASAIAFSDPDARALIVKSTMDAAPPGSRLVGSVAIDDYNVLFSAADATVTVSATAHEYVVKQVAAESLPSRLRGLDSSSAAEVVKVIAPDAVVDIRMSPVTVPWLPLNADHISIVVTSTSAPPAT